jgi:hypothetical protein
MYFYSKFISLPMDNSGGEYNVEILLKMIRHKVMQTMTWYNPVNIASKYVCIFEPDIPILRANVLIPSS